MFGARFARRSLKRYTTRGLDRIEARMVASAAESPLDGARVLEIGGGIGKLQVELLAAGAAQGEVVELLSAYEPYALELAREKGLEGRTTFRVSDILEEPGATEPADVVFMNRVVCCSPDGVALTGEAARLARRVLVLSVPRDEVWMRAAVGLMNAWFRLIRRSFRVFVHSRAALREVAEAQGLQLADSGRGVAWEFLTFRRGGVEGRG